MCFIIIYLKKLWIMYVFYYYKLKNILSWISGIPSRQNGMKNVLASSKNSNKFRNGHSLLILSIVPSHLLSHLGRQINSLLIDSLYTFRKKVIYEKVTKWHIYSRPKMFFKTGAINNFAIFNRRTKNSFFIEHLQWLFLATKNISSIL